MILVLAQAILKKNSALHMTIPDDLKNNITEVLTNFVEVIHERDNMEEEEVEEMEPEVDEDEYVFQDTNITQREKEVVNFHRNVLMTLFRLQSRQFDVSELIIKDWERFL